MTLRASYRIGATLLALYALAVIVEPAALLTLVDEKSLRTNRQNILIGFFATVVWALGALVWLARNKPDTDDWPPARPVWLGIVWLALSVSYTGFEHGWFEYPALVYEEDGLFETATAAILLVCAVMLVRMASREARGSGRSLIAALIGLAIVCILLMLEEISWGQRIFGWETPEEISELNVQRETNLHNMFVGFNQLIRLGIVLVAATMLITRAAWVRWLSPAGLSPLVPPAPAVYFIPFALYAHTYDELFEEVMAVFMLAWVIDLRRRLRAAG